MNYLIQFQINLFALLMLAVLFICVRTSVMWTFSKQLFSKSLIATALAVIIEPLTWILDRKVFPGAFFLEYISNFALFLAAPVIGGLLMAYVDYRLFHNPQRISRRLYYQHASIFTLGILTVNLFLPVYFSVDPIANAYGSGDYKLLHFFVVGIIYLYMLFFVVKNRRRVSQKEVSIYYVFFSLPIVGMLAQLISSRLNLSWTSVALALMVIYMLLETTSSEEDHLTKLFSRKSFDTHLSYLSQTGKDFGVVLFDLDNFKGINDRYGHQAGDDVLTGFADALKESFKRTGLTSRIGGDEFAVLVYDDNIEAKIDALNALLRGHSSLLIREMSYSYGFQKHADGMTPDALFSAADHRMYAQKNAIKAQLT